MEGPPSKGSDVPRLRTLLMTDLCDSAALVERMGDAAAALFREHDQLVLRLQQQWRGQLIDRSDGLLLLFERPEDGLGFALDYQRGLGPLGQAHGVRLAARAGLHVGEVVSWANDAEAVRNGARPLEVEGPARPVAARLMALARPGQILLSHVAQSLARRAERELAAGGARTLAWKDHGRWRFKGLPEPVEVHEAGEPGIAPLAPPRPADGKARRELPAWRRPLALSVQVAAVLGLAIGLWLASRSEPAIAFAERDWVVVGSLRNLTGHPMFDKAVEQAFRISLEQSRHVNVLSELKVRQTLEQMELDPDETALDRALASRVAMRDGARAVILPTVAEVDGRLQFSIEVVDPVSQATVYSRKASGQGVGSILASVDEVASDLRRSLGEAIATIDSDGVSLSQATTSELEALRAYALGEAAMAQRRYDEARSLYENALRIDPGFARAHLGLAGLQWAMARQSEARAHVAQAVRLRNTLAPRERLLVDAWETEVAPSGNPLAEWLALARLYPDYLPARSNAAWYLLVDNRFEESLEHAAAASVPQAPMRTYTMVHAARALNALGRPQEALQMLDQAQHAGRAPAVGARAEVLVALGRREEARQVLADSRPEDGTLIWLLAQRGLASLALVEGDRARAVELAGRARWRAVAMPDPFPRHFSLVDATVRALAGDPLPEAALRQLAEDFRTALGDANMPSRHEELFRAATLAYLAQRQGYRRLAAECLGWIEPEAASMPNAALARLISLVRANQLRLDGRPREGIDLLAPQLDGTELVQTRVVMRELYRAVGDVEGAAVQDRWLKAHVGQAWSEVPVTQLLQPFNAVDVAQAGRTPAGR